MFGLPGVDGGGRPRYLPPLRNAGGAYRPTRRDPPVPENDARRPTTYAPSSRARYAFVAVEEWASGDALVAHLRQPPITDFLRDLPTARGRRDRPGAVPSGAARRPRRPRSRCTRSPAPGRCRSDNRAAAVDITRTESQQTRCSEHLAWRLLPENWKASTSSAGGSGSAVMAGVSKLRRGLQTMRDNAY